MKNSAGSIALAILLTTLLITPGASGSRLDRQVVETELTAASPIQALFKMAAEYEIPLGIVWVDSPNNENPVDIMTRGLTVRQAMQKVVSLMPQEQLSVDGAVVHILSGQTSTRASWLSVKFPEYGVDRELTSLANAHLLQRIQSKQIEQGTRSNKRPLGGCGGHLTLGMGDVQMSFRLNNPTVQQILDSFVENSGLKIWIVTLPYDESGDNHTKQTSLWSSSIPDNDQPYWQLLAWGIDPKSGGYRREWIQSKAVTSSN